MITEKDLLSLKIKDIKQNKAKNKLLGIVFARACSSLGVLIYHYFGHSKSKYKILRKTANSTWGFIFSTTFFCISGSVLYYNYPKITSLKKFYYKRWKSIYPSYYISFLYFFLTTAFAAHKLFYRGSWTKLLYTLIGLDGYLSYKIRTYFIVGEWFLGAIIILYVLYPLFLWIVNINIFIIYSLIIIGYFIMHYTNSIIFGLNIFLNFNLFYL